MKDLGVNNKHWYNGLEVATYRYRPTHNKLAFRGRTATQTLHSHVLLIHFCVGDSIRILIAAQDNSASWLGGFLVKSNAGSTRMHSRPKLFRKSRPECVCSNYSEWARFSRYVLARPFLLLPNSASLGVVIWAGYSAWRAQETVVHENPWVAYRLGTHVTLEEGRRKLK